MLESDNDPVRKQKFPVNLIKESRNKVLVVFPLWFWVWFFFPLGTRASS